MAATHHHDPSKVEKNKLTITVVGAKGLKAADLNGKSDPYVVIKDVKGLNVPGSSVKTKIKDKTLEPVWNETFEFPFSYALSKLVFKVYDHDKFTEDDEIGKLKIPAEKVILQSESEGWFQLHPQGQLHLKFKVEMSYHFVIPGAHLPINTRQFTIGLGWDTSKKTGSIDLDTSVLVYDEGNNVTDTVFYGHLEAFKGGIRHKGDNRTGEGTGDDEEIMIDLDKIPQSVKSLVVVVNSFSGVTFDKLKSAYVRLKDGSGKTLVLSRLSGLSASTGLLFGFLYFVPSAGQWFFKTVAAPLSGKTAKDSAKDVVPLLQYY